MRPLKTASENGRAVRRISTRTARFLLILGVLALAGFAIRLAVSWELGRNDPFAYAPGPETDMATYLKLSAEIGSGNYSGAFYYQPFYYAVFLPAVRFLFRSDVLAVCVSQSLCGLGIIWFAGLGAAWIKGRFAGLCAGFLAAFSTMLTFYVPYALIEIQMAFWVTLLFYLIVRAYRRGGLLCWCTAGLVLGIAVLSRGNAWCFLPVLVLAAWWSRRGRTKRFAAACGLALLFAVLPQVPYAVRNSRAEGRLCGPSTAGGAVLALANNPESTPGSQVRPYPRIYRYWMDHREETGIGARIMRLAASEPAACLEFEFRKFLLFWDAREIPNSVSLEANGSKSHVLALAFVPTSVLLLLTIAALFFDGRRLFRKKLLLAAALFVLLYAVALTASTIMARFRVPLMGVLCVTSAFALTSIRRNLKNGSWKRPLNLAALPIGFCAVFLLYGTYQFFWEAGIMRLVRPDGVLLEYGESEAERLDHSTIFNGNRDMIALKPGVTLVKRFSPAQEGTKYEKAALRFEIFAEKPDVLRMEVNGVPFELNLETPVRAGLPLYEAETGWLPPSQDGTYRIRITGSDSGESALLTDVTRDYGRTEADGKTIPAEACVRLVLKR